MRFLSLLSSVIPVFLSILVSSSSSHVTKPTQLVDNVCKQISNYTFCVDTLYTDPRVQSPDADSYLLAYISFGLAYLNATDTLSQIGSLLKTAARKHKVDSIEGLRRCESGYRKAVSALEEAYNDLNSETFSNLKDLVGVASNAADDCEGAFKKTGRTSPLTKRNEDLKGLCEICVVVSNLFT